MSLEHGTCAIAGPPRPHRFAVGSPAEAAAAPFFVGGPLTPPRSPRAHPALPRPVVFPSRNGGAEIVRVVGAHAVTCRAARHAHARRHAGVRSRGESRSLSEQAGRSSPRRAVARWASPTSRLAIAMRLDQHFQYHSRSGRTARRIWSCITLSPPLANSPGRAWAGADQRCVAGLLGRPRLHDGVETRARRCGGQSPHLQRRRAQ